MSRTGNLIFLGDRIAEAREFQPDLQNRAFRYGDAVFETIRICEGVPLFFDLHYQRFLSGLDTLHMQVPDHWQPEFLRAAMRDLSRHCALPHARLRMTAWREGGGRYLPERHSPGLVMEVEKLLQPAYTWSPTGLTLDLADGITIGRSPLDRVKSANSLPYILAAIQARDRGLDDVILRHESGHLVEASSSNLFVVRDGMLLSPPEDDGGVCGVMRKVLIQIAEKEGITFQARTLQPEDLLSADEVFLTNVISSIRWVARFRDLSFSNQFSTQLFQKLILRVSEQLSS